MFIRYIKLNTKFMKRREDVILAKDNIIDLYVNQRKSMIEIGKLYNCDNTLLSNYFRKWGVKAYPHTESARKYFINERYFEKIDTEDKAYFLGLLYADGSISKSRISISLIESELYILQNFQKYLNYFNPIYFFAKEREKRFDNKDSNRLTIYSKKLAEDIAKLGCIPRKSYCVQFPTTEQIPNDFMPHFIRGFLDGNGCIYTYSWKRPRNCSIIFVSSKDFCTGLKNYIENNFDISCYIYDKANNIAELRFFGIKKVIPFLEYLYKDAINFFNRKREIYEKLKTFY